MKRLLALAFAALCVFAPATALADAFSSEMIALGPEYYYRLDESSGTTVADSSGNGLNATNLTPSSITLGVAGLVAGSSDTAYSFNATTSQLERNGPNVQTNVTYVFLVDASSYAAPAFLNVLAVQNASAGIYANHPACQGGALGYASSLYLTNGVPHMVVVESTGNNSYASLDGSGLVFMPTGGSQCAEPQHTNNYLRIGYNPYYARNAFEGTVDEVAFFEHNLSAVQICLLATLAGFSQCAGGGGLFLGAW